MQISENGIAFIKQCEGYAATPYVCPAGKWTVGYGHVIPAALRYSNLTEAQAHALLLQDLMPVEGAIGELIDVPLAQHQFDALCSLILNIGIGAFSGSTLRKKLNGGQPDAPKQFLRWIYANKKPLPGLKRRREQEMQMFLYQQLIPNALA